MSLRLLSPTNNLPDVFRAGFYLIPGTCQKGFKGDCSPCPVGRFKKEDEPGCADVQACTIPSMYRKGANLTDEGTCTECETGQFRLSSHEVDKCKSCEDEWKTSCSLTTGQTLEGCGGSSGGTCVDCPEGRAKPLTYGAACVEYPACKWCLSASRSTHVPLRPLRHTLTCTRRALYLVQQALLESTFP